jgi:hypothetical protein
MGDARTLKEVFCVIYDICRRTEMEIGSRREEYRVRASDRWRGRWRRCWHGHLLETLALPLVENACKFVNEILSESRSCLCIVRNDYFVHGLSTVDIQDQRED